MQELQEMKNHQPIIEIPQKSNEEIPIMESGEESQTDEEILANNPIMDEKSLKGEKKELLKENDSNNMLISSCK